MIVESRVLYWSRFQIQGFIETHFVGKYSRIWFKEKFNSNFCEDKHREAFSTLVASLVQMTCIDFTNFEIGRVKCRIEFTITFWLKKFIKSRCWLVYSTEIRVLYCKLGQSKKIREINAGHLGCHLYQGLDQRTKGFFMFVRKQKIFTKFKFFHLA